LLCHPAEAAAEVRRNIEGFEVTRKIIQYIDGRT